MSAITNMSQIFGVDIGNSGLRVAELDIAARALGEVHRIRWSLSDMQDNLRRGKDSDRYRPADMAWTNQLRRFLDDASVELSSTTTRWFIGSVRRDAMAVLHAFLQQNTRHQITVVDHLLLPLAFAVESPGRVGIDRLLAALAASELTTDRPVIVVQAGSAVTVDLLSAAPGRSELRYSPTIASPIGDDQAFAPSDSMKAHARLLGTFEGGAIIPGVPMMLRLLGRGADLLPEIDADDLLELPKIPGRDTEQAMICGAASALVGGITHLIEGYRSQFGGDVPVILSGGDGTRLAPHVPAPVIDRPHLVHLGLLKLAVLLS